MSGPQKYDEWVAHKLPANDPGIRAAWEKFGQIALPEGQVAGGRQAMVLSPFFAIGGLAHPTVFGGPHPSLPCAPNRRSTTWSP